MSKRRQSSGSSSCTRVLMYEWLVETANQELHGLTWLSKNERILRIPWKHAAKHTFDSHNDSQLFCAWAKHTNKYVGCEDDTKKWKANFRCALNSQKSQIRYEKSLSCTHGEMSFRAYRMLPKDASAPKSGRLQTSKRRRTIETPSDHESWDSHSSGVCSNEDMSESEGEYNSVQSDLPSLQESDALQENATYTIENELKENECFVEIVDLSLDEPAEPQFFSEFGENVAELPWDLPVGDDN